MSKQSEISQANELNGQKVSDVRLLFQPLVGEEGVGGTNYIVSLFGIQYSEFHLSKNEIPDCTKCNLSDSKIPTFPGTHSYKSRTAHFECMQIPN